MPPSLQDCRLCRPHFSLNLGLSWCFRFLLTYLDLILASIFPIFPSFISTFILNIALALALALSIPLLTESSLQPDPI